MPQIPVPVSQFPTADLPLDGDEYVPIVQDGITKRTTSNTFAAFGGSLVPEVTLNLGAGTFNNVDPQGALHLFIDTSAGNVIITGFLPPTVAGSPLMVTNLGTTNSLQLNNQDGGSDAINRLYGIDDVILPPRTSLLLYYSEDTLTNWVMV